METALRALLKVIGPARGPFGRCVFVSMRAACFGFEISFCLSQNSSYPSRLPRKRSYDVV